MAHARAFTIVKEGLEDSVGALVIANIILELPNCTYSIMYTKTLFYLLQPLHYINVIISGILI